MPLSPYYAPALARYSITGQAFEALPKISKSVLWSRHIERLNAKEIGVLHKLKPHEVAFETARAQNEFRKAWVQLHAHHNSTSPECAHYAHTLAAATPTIEGDERARNISDHLITCLRCAILTEELDHIEEHLNIMLKPLLHAPNPDSHDK
ncbi:hypothetical protein [Timonella sp. A28]|uniref:hypothetical protein n=1 Tax=Timonella sp. A28 TaxID=3442640 RepID=UPI003EB6A0AD